MRWLCPVQGWAPPQCAAWTTNSPEAQSRKLPTGEPELRHLLIQAIPEASPRAHVHALPRQIKTLDTQRRGGLITLGWGQRVLEAQPTASLLIKLGVLWPRQQQNTLDGVPEQQKAHLRVLKPRPKKRGTVWLGLPILLVSVPWWWKGHGVLGRFDNSTSNLCRDLVQHTWNFKSACEGGPLYRRELQWGRKGASQQATVKCC